mgnify:CR=1 FL=1|tara:strand:- start:32 stop:394 length:363 start_codon:yes stop_codon:yes gene_type:complete
MDTFKVYSDIASICLEIGGNFFPVPNEIGCDGKYDVVVVDVETDRVNGINVQSKLGVEWCLHNTLQINQDNCYLHSSDCARLDESGGLPSHHERLYQFKQGNYEIYRDGGNFLFIRFERE